MSIPKIIHYCWFGPNKIPTLTEKFIKTWKKHLPDYKIMLWTEETFYANDHPFMQRCMREKTWGFIGDYVRFRVLYDYGGIYLDTDIRVNKNLDRFLDRDFFLSFMDKATLATACIGSVNENETILGILKLFDEDRIPKGVQSNHWVTKYFLDNFQNFKLLGKTHEFTPNQYIYHTEYFDNASINKNRGYATHAYFGSWFGRGPKVFFSKINRIYLIAKFLRYKAFLVSPFLKIHKEEKKKAREKKKNNK